MSLVPWKGKRAVRHADDAWTGSPVTRFRQEMDQLFERFFGGACDAMEAGYGAFAGWAPTIDISESDDEVTVRAEVPGVAPQDLEITVAGHTLTIAGEKKEATENKGENFFHTERRFGSFRRSIELPASVDTENIEAEDHNGVVLIHLKKVAGAASKRIQVKSAAD